MPTVALLPFDNIRATYKYDGNELVWEGDVAPRLHISYLLDLLTRAASVVTE